jgi:hypothetical protein
MQIEAKMIEIEIHKSKTSIVMVRVGALWGGPNKK